MPNFLLERIVSIKPLTAGIRLEVADVDITSALEPADIRCMSFARSIITTRRHVFDSHLDMRARFAKSHSPACCSPIALCFCLPNGVAGSKPIGCKVVVGVGKPNTRIPGQRRFPAVRVGIPRHICERHSLTNIDRRLVFGWVGQVRLLAAESAPRLRTLWGTNRSIADCPNDPLICGDPQWQPPLTTGGKPSP